MSQLVSPGNAIASFADVNHLVPAMPSRLLVVALSLDVGGAERHLSSVLPALARRGWPITIYCTNRLGIYAERLEAAGIEVIGPPISRSAGDQPKPARLWATGRAGLDLAGVMRRLRPDIVHFFLPEPYIIGAPSAILLRTPVRILSRRGLNLYQRKWPGAAAIERRLHRHMTAFLANSRRVGADLEAEGCPPDRIGLIYNGLALEGLDQPPDRAGVRQSLGIEPEAMVAIVVANLIGYKGHADVLEALAKVREQLPNPCHLLCVGRDEGARAGLEAAANKLGLGDIVRFLGVRHDVARLLGAADMSILASHEEGFSNAVIEAMGAGLPLVVTDVGGNAEAVVDGETGFVVPPHNPDLLAPAILRLATDPDLRRRFGAAGQARADALFTLDACVDRYETFYRGLMRGASPADLALA